MVEQKEWIIPCNTDYFDIGKALVALKMIDWKQPIQMKNANVGDLVYMYCKPSGKTGSILYKGAILEVNKYENIIDDLAFSVDDRFASGPCCTLAMFRVYELGDELSYANLKAAGLKSRLQGPVVVKGSLADYLHSCDARQRQLDRLDGSIPAECLVNFPITIKENTTHNNSVVAPLDDTHSEEEKEEHASSLGINDLEVIAKAQSRSQAVEVTRPTVQRIRDPYIAEYARRRANGICQLCGVPAPFNRSDGSPYLESHHIEWLSEGGADSVDNTVALCPNCHRKMHIVADPEDAEWLKRVNSKLVEGET